MPAELESFLPILIFLVVVLGFAASALIASHLIGPTRKVNPIRDLPYESGMDPVGSARQHFDIKFYLVAVLFLVFDVELLFLYPWAVSAYQQSPGHWDPDHRRQVFWLITIFLATLAVSFIYAWRKGVFRWR